MMEQLLSINCLSKVKEKTKSQNKTKQFTPPPIEKQNKTEKKKKNQKKKKKKKKRKKKKEKQTKKKLPFLFFRENSEFAITSW